MVDIVKRSEREPATLNRLGLFFHHDGSTTPQCSHWHSMWTLCFSPKPEEMAMTTSHQRCILKIQKPVYCRFLFRPSYFCTNIWILSRDHVPLKREDVGEKEAMRVDCDDAIMKRIFWLGLGDDLRCETGTICVISWPGAECALQRREKKTGSAQP